MKRLVRAWIWFSAGVTLAALAAKLTLKSKGEPTSEEIDLVSIFDGIHLVTEASPFYGGNVMAVCGGVLLDLRQATPSPTGIHLDVIAFWGGVSVIVPSGWRVENKVDVIAGGFEDKHDPGSNPDAPVVRITGRVVMAGLQVATRSPVDEAS